MVSSEKSSEKILSLLKTEPELAAREIGRQLALSREALARELGVSYATVNWSENGLSRPSRLARAQLDAFCAKMTKQGNLKLSGSENE